MHIRSALAAALGSLILAGLLKSQTPPDQASPAPASKPIAVSDAAFWRRVFVDHHVLEVQLNVSRKDWTAMQDIQRHDSPSRSGHSQKYPYARATITLDGEKFADAGLRFKGNSSFGFSRRSLRKPFKIDLDRFEKTHEFHGRTKLNLSNTVLDSTRMKEKLGYEIYRAAGLPTPGVGWAHVTLNVEGIADNKSLGVYVVIEQVDKRYVTRARGKAAKGSLLMKPDAVDDWEHLGDDPKAYERYNIRSGAKNEDQIRQFAALLKLIKSGSDEEFAAEIGKRMDLDMMAGYLAATSVLSSLDSYVGMPHNYYLLQDRTDDKLRLLPWDLNETFGTFSMGIRPEALARWSIDRPWNARRRILERLFAMPSFVKSYRAKLQQLVDGAFTEEKMFARIMAFEKAITQVMKKHGLKRQLRGLRMGIDGDEDGRNQAVQRPTLALKPFIRIRVESLKAQLAGKSKGRPIQIRRRRR